MRTQKPESCVICESPLAGPRIQRRTCDNAACRFAYQRHLRAGRATCTECGRPLSAIEEAQGAQSCRDDNCRVNARLHHAIGNTERCRVCRARLTPGRVSSGVCSDLDCQSVAAWRHEAALAATRLDEFVEQARLATLLRDESGAAAAIARPEEHLVTVVPRLPNRLVGLPDERRKAFREKIESLVRELPDSSDANLDPTEKPPSIAGDSAQGYVSPADRLVGAVCAACRGFCCRRGDTHAFLQVDMLLRLLRRRPELRREQLASAYVERLPERSFADSCVFHGEAGCALTRDMRSDTCNNYFCGGQQNLRAALDRGAPPRAFVAISDGAEIVAGQFLNADADVPSADCLAAGIKDC